VVAGHIVPLDTIGVEVVQDAQANLWMRGIFSGSPVVRLGKVGASGVGPVCAGREGDGSGGPVVPEHGLLCVVNNTTCPEVSLGILGNQSVELILFGRGIQGDGLHAHGVAVLLGLALLELGAPKLPGYNIPSADVVSGVRPEVVGGLGSTQCGSSCNPVLLRLAYGDRLGPEGGSRGGGGGLGLDLSHRQRLLLLLLERLLLLGLELLLLGLELLLLGLERLLRLEGGSSGLTLLWLELLLRSPLRRGPRVTEKVVERPSNA